MNPSPGSLTPPATEQPRRNGIRSHRLLRYRLVATGQVASGRHHQRVRRVAAGAGYVLAFALVAVYVHTAVGYHVGSLRTPGPGLFPLVAMTILSVGLVGLAVERRRTPPVAPRATPDGDPDGDPDAVGLDWASPLRVGAVLVLSVGYILVTPVLGDLASGSLFALGVLLVMGNPLWLTVLGGLALGLGSHYLFVTVLGLPLGHGSGF